MLIDALSKRYGVMPHAWLSIDYADFLFDLMVAELGAKAEAEEIKQIERKMRS